MAAAFCGIVLTEIAPVPSTNEQIYLVWLKTLADPTFLAGDWTFASGFNEHFVWGRFFAPAMSLLGLEALGWTGRLLVWVAVATLLVLIGRTLGAHPIWSGVGLWMWMGLNQGMGVGAAKILSGFQASAVAYPFLLGGLLAAIRGRIALAMLLGGVAFSFHPGVGLWGSGALAMALLIIPDSRRQALRSLWILVVASLPGAIPQIMSLGGATNTQLLALSRVPHHVDPFDFGERGPALLALMVAFNLCLSWAFRAERSHRVLGVVQGLLLVPALLGVIARLTGQFWFLLLYPFRVLPPLAVAIFMLNLAAIVTQRRWNLLWPFASETRLHRVGRLAGGVAVVGVLVLWNPIFGFGRTVAANLDDLTAPASDFEGALSWIATSTEATTQVLAPPHEDSIFYLTERPQYVSWGAIPYDRMDEWIRRLDAVVTAEFITEVRRANEWQEQYRSLTVEEILALRPAVDVVVTDAEYPLELLFESGDWNVYSTSR